MRRLLLTLTTLLLACAPRGGAQAQGATTGDGLPPIGYGTLRQDDLSVTLATTDLQVRFLPLDERVIRLLGNDAYGSLHQLVDAKRAAIDSVVAVSGTSSPGLILVSFFGLTQGALFDPQDVSVIIRSQLYRPLGVVPYNASFNSRQLNVRQQATAIYLFDQTIPVYETFTLSYGSSRSDGWKDVLPRIEREQARVAGRARREGKDTVAKP
jgi:hypothetical protein